MKQVPHQTTENTFLSLFLVKAVLGTLHDMKKSDRKNETKERQTQRRLLVMIFLLLVV